jgi:probable HAF family extracellular repeat protein
VPDWFGTLGGATSLANGLNGRGQVVGLSVDAAGRNRAFIWQQGQLRDLNTLVDPPLPADVLLVDAKAINDAGQIAGVSCRLPCSPFASVHRAFLLTPNA